MTRFTEAVPVVDASQVAGARRIAARWAEELRLGERAAGRATIAATELATNLVKHGGGGTLLFGVGSGSSRSLSVLAIDKGPGISDHGVAMSDGFSTTGTQGTGLGAVNRAAAHFEMYSRAGEGSAILCRIEDDGGRPSAGLLDAPPRITAAGIGVPKPGEVENGDAWTAMLSNDVCTVAVADGLGHGPAAGTASAAAVRVIADGIDQSLESVLQDSHGALRPTRGAAIGIARVYSRAGRIDFTGVGNIVGTIASDESVRKVVSLPGIVGHEMRKVQTFSYPWTASSVLILHSDGISASWNPTRYPGLLQHDPAIIAAVLFRDHCRGSDDATIVVTKAS